MERFVPLFEEFKQTVNETAFNDMSDAFNTIRSIIDAYVDKVNANLLNDVKNYFMTTIGLRLDDRIINTMEGPSLAKAVRMSLPLKIKRCLGKLTGFELRSAGEWNTLIDWPSVVAAAYTIGPGTPNEAIGEFNLAWQNFLKKS